jgi:hypothetical protein
VNRLAAAAHDAAGILVPVRRVHNRYRIEDLGEVSDPHIQASLRGLVQRRYTITRGYVEAAGRLSETDVFVTPDDDGGYVEVGSDGLPISSEEVRGFPSTTILARYLKRLMATWSKSDSLTPDLKTPLDSWFIEPSATWLAERDSNHAAWHDIHNETRLVILGPPGAGKTSCLRRIVYESAKASIGSDDPSIPIYVQLRDLPLEGDFDSAQIESIVSANDEDLKHILRDRDSLSRILLVLDGLDEVPSAGARRQVLDYVTRLCLTLPTVRVVLSTRELSYEQHLPDFAHVRLEPFNESQIAKWSLQYIARHRPRHDWAAFIDHLSQTPDVAALATNPLLLSLIASLFVRDRVLPENKALVLERCFEALLQDWDAARGVLRWPDSPAMHRQIRLALSALSYAAIEEGTEEFAEADLNRQTERLVGLRSSSLTILNACTTSGLTERRGEHRWVFKNYAIRDYLAARFLIDSTEDISRYFISTPISVARLKIWELSCAMATDASELLEIRRSAASTDPLESAASLASVFRQDITASRAAVINSCVTIREALEKHGDTFAMVGNADVTKAIEPAIRWSIGLRPEQKPSLRLLIRILESVFGARHGTAFEQLSSTLRASKNEMVRHVAASMLVEGNYRSIYPPSGEIAVILFVKNWTRDPLDTSQTVDRRPLGASDCAPQIDLNGDK